MPARCGVRQGRHGPLHQLAFRPAAGRRARLGPVVPAPQQMAAQRQRVAQSALRQEPRRQQDRPPRHLQALMARSQCLASPAALLPLQDYQPEYHQVHRLHRRVRHREASSVQWQ
jgi:hypothetical protein